MSRGRHQLPLIESTSVFRAQSRQKRDDFRYWTTFVALVFLIIFACLPISSVAEVNLNGKTAFEVLGVKKTATNDEIRDVYKKLAAKFHPDRPDNKGLPEAVVRERFQKIKACYEAIEALDERILDFLGIKLGLTYEEIRERGATGYNAAKATEAETQNPNWFSESVDEGLKDFFGQARPQPSASREVGLEAAFFPEGIYQVYQNEDGVIIRDKHSTLSWIPRDSRIVYPLKSYLTGHLENLLRGTFFDTRDPEGTVQLIIDEKLGTLKVRDMVFRKIPVDVDYLNRSLNSAGFKMDGSRPTDKDLNRWHYQIFFDGNTYTILARLSYRDRRGEYVSEYRLFVGTSHKMEEIRVYLNPMKSRLEVPSKNIYFHTTSPRHIIPFQDSATGFNMGTIDLSPRPMDIYNISTGKVIVQIPPLAREEIYKLSLSGLLGPLISMPKIVRTPLDRHWISKLRPKDPVQPLLGVNGPAKSSAPSQSIIVATPQPTPQPSTTALTQARMSIEAAIQEMKFLFPDIGLYLEFPNNDPQRLAAEFLLLQRLSVEDLRQYLLTNIHRGTVIDVIIRFFNKLNTWELLEATMFIPELVLEHYIHDHRKVTLLVMFSIRHMIQTAPWPLPDRLMRIIYRVRSLNEEVLDSYLDQYIDERRRNAPPAISGPGILRLEDSPCGKLLIPGTNRPLLGK